MPNQAEGLAPINGVCLNLALVASTRLLVELYMLITSIRYPHSISWYTEAPSPSPKIQVGSVAASSADRWLARTDAAGGHQRGVRFVRLRPGQWEGPALFKLALLLLVEVYQLSGHRIAAEPGSKIVLVTPTRRVAHFITALGLSNATTASINGGEARRAAFVGTTLRAFVETGLPDLPAPGHLRAADAQTLFEYLRDHQWELGAFIDLHTATVCAGSTGAVDILVVDTVGRFTEYGEDALQRLTAGSTRPTGPLLVASPTAHPSLGNPGCHGATRFAVWHNGQL